MLWVDVASVRHILIGLLGLASMPGSGLAVKAKLTPGMPVLGWLGGGITTSTWSLGSGNVPCQILVALSAVA